MPLQLAHRSQPDRSRGARRTAIRQGPTYQRRRRTRRPPTAASGSRRSRCWSTSSTTTTCRASCSRRPIRTMLRAALDVPDSRGTASRASTTAPSSCSHGGVDPKNREDMFRGNAAMGYAPFATDHDDVQARQGLIQMRKDHVGAAPRHGRRRCGRRRSRARAATPASSRSSASTPATRPRSSCSTRATQTSETCAPTDRGGACMHDDVPAGHDADRRDAGQRRRDVHGARPTARSTSRCRRAPAACS